MLSLCHYKCNNYITHDCITYWCTQNYCLTIAQSLKVTVSWCSARIRSARIYITTPIYAWISITWQSNAPSVAQLDQTPAMYTPHISHVVKVLWSKSAMDYHLALMKWLMDYNTQDRYTCKPCWTLWAFCSQHTKNHSYSSFRRACGLWLGYGIDYWYLVP